ncbi:MAG: metalloregulator ArsR/SmtB family transcription factor [Actinomycetes bacterium]
MPAPLYRAKADFFRALGHPARIRLLELLADGDKPVHELRAAIKIEASSLSHQLAVLRQHGLVHQRREAGAVIYSLALPAVRDLLLAARQILQGRTLDTDEFVDELSRSADTR